MKSDCFVVFDVETPNSFNNRMSAIGITLVEDGEITDTFYSLVNPEQPFDYFNEQLTGITEELVTDKPTFPELWETLKGYFDKGVLVAHNAPFDMSVLASCLNHYEIEWKDTAEYLCTVQIGRRVLKVLPNRRLNTICDYLGIELDHHNAGSDSDACAEILQFYMDNEVDFSRYIKKYNFNKLNMGY